MLLAEFIKDATSALEQLYPAPEARNIILMLCEHHLGTKSYTHIIEPQYEVPEEKLQLILEAVQRLAKGEPIQHVIGCAEFFGRSFNVSSSVLIPRPETEILVSMAVDEAGRLMKSNGAVRALDLCTGSGCIAWSVALSVPGSEVVAVDLSEDALKVAASQPFEDEGARRPEFVKADVLETEQDFARGEFDLILSNPPYIMDSEKAHMRVNVLDYEPDMALFVRDDDPLIFYRAVAQWCRRFLRAGGLGIVEINEALGPETAAVFEAAGMREVVQVKDFYDKIRFISFRK